MARLQHLAFALALSSVSLAQNDEEYGKKIKEYTTETFFSTELVDHLPASATVPSPLKHFGHIIGTPDRLHYVDEINGYMKALDAASPRVVVQNIGKSEGGRDMLMVLVSSEANLARLDRLKEINGLLGDPRKLTQGGYKGDGKLQGADDAAEKLIAEGVPFYYATAGMHSTEAGPPEMVLEMAYRLAVSEDPFIKTIRDNSVVMITPVLDPDGRDRYVDTYHYGKKNPGKSIPLIYWGEYVAHDNNRDGMGMALKLSQNVMKSWMDFKPHIMHDLHESVPFLYISTGTGPYNAWLDPITVDEWHIMAYHEVNEMTRRGVPGVWTHGFYDGWAPNYAFYAANGHNAIGRFYETQGGLGADTRVINVGGQSQRDWFRPNPPYSRVKWSLRNNTNLMQSGVLLGLNHTATEKDKFLRNYYLKSKRSVLKPWNEGPAAYVLPASEKRLGLQSRLLKLMEGQGVEVFTVGKDVETRDGKFKADDVVVRMDQPYSRMADMLLDKQYYNPSDPRPYDDTGWTLGSLFNLNVIRAKDPAILGSQGGQRQGFDPMAVKPASAPTGDPFQFLAGNKQKFPRIALVHTWTNTQDEGWVRVALDELKVPYKYVSVHELRDTADLRKKYDVIIMGQVGGSSTSIVNGRPMVGDPIPWKPFGEYKHLGGPDKTDDMRGGIELQGMLHIQKFLNDGGLAIFMGNSSRVPVEYGLVNGVSVVEQGDLFAPGGVFLAENASKESPIMAGYDDTVPVYFGRRSVLLSTGGGGGFGGGGEDARPSGRGDLKDPDIAQGRPPHTQEPERDQNQTQGAQAPRPEVLLRFAPLDKLLISGGLDKGELMAGRAALVRCPVGKGNVLLFSINPMWRHETMGSWQLVLNAAMNWNSLSKEKKN
jgi:hypothetical protein